MIHFKYRTNSKGGEGNGREGEGDNSLVGKRIEYILEGNLENPLV